jgi:hypothetical protein
VTCVALRTMSASASARSPARSAGERSPHGARPWDIVPTAADAELAALELELPTPDHAAAVARCLRDANLGPALLLRREAASPDAPLHARLLLTAPKAEPGPPPPRSIEHVREDLSRCAGLPRIAVLAPDADADHLASLVLLGPDPAALADLADRAAARLRALPGVSLLRLRASRPRPVRALTIDRAAAADRGVDPRAVSDAARLAAGPLQLGVVAEVPVLLDMLERPGSIEQVLPDLSVSSSGGPAALTAVVAVSTASAPAPLYRIAQSNAAAVELGLRRAADREAVLDAIKDLELPTGVWLRLGGEFPRLEP